MFSKWAAMCSAIVFLASCGGGGGGDSNPPAISFSPASISGNQRAASVGTYSVTVTASDPSAFNGSVYAIVQDAQKVLSGSVGLSTVSTGVYSATLRTSATLPIGRYQGAFSVQLCRDAQCLQQYPGSPVSLPYDFSVVDKPLVVSAQTITNASAHVGGSEPASVAVAVSGPAAAWAADTGASWLKIDPGSGTAPGSFKVRYAVGDLRPGRYVDKVTVRSTDGQTAEVSFALEMLETQFSFNTNTLSFSAVNGAPVPPQSVSFELDNRTATAWTATTTAPWLLVDPASGVTPGTLGARVDPSKGNLASGTYSADVVLAASGYPTKSMSAKLTLTKPMLSTPSATINLGGPKGRDSAAQTLAMSLNTGANQWPWTLSQLPTWLSASDTSGKVGLNGSQLSFSPSPSAPEPGSYSTVATITATVNGDIASLPVTVNLNRDKRKLLPAEWGVGFAVTPQGAVTSRTVQVSDNFGGAIAWTASSSAPWLTVTGSGTTGAGNGIALAADPATLAAGTMSYATVTISATTPGIEPAVIKVGLWRSNDGVVAVTKLPAGYTRIVADRIRPFIYASNGGTSIDVYNAHLGTKIGSIPNVGFALGDMAVSPDGSRLYVLDPGNNAMPIIDLDSRQKVETWPLVSAPSNGIPESLVVIRPNGKEVVLTTNRIYFSDGYAYADGKNIAKIPSLGYALAASSDGRRVFAQDSGLSPASVGAFDVDYSAIAGGTLLVQRTAGAGFINGASNGQDIAVNADATAVYTASGAPYRCSSVNPSTLKFIASLPGGDAYPNNVEVTSDGRVICGISGWYSSSDIWVHSSAGAVLKSFKFAGYARELLPRGLVVTPDGMTAVGITDDPLTAFIPLGK